MATAIMDRDVGHGTAPAADTARLPGGWRDVSWLTWWTWGLIALGIAWRLVRYLLQSPISGDEPLFALNMVNRDFAQAFEPLGLCQVAPPFFLLIEWLAYHGLGGSELAMRLVPELAGVLSLLLFKQLAERLLSPLAAAMAIGVLAVSFIPVKMSSYVKPYSLDLLCSICLLWLVVRYLESPRQSRWLWLLACAVPVALFVSFPAVFIVAAIGLGLLPIIWQQRSLKILTAYAALGLASAGSFALVYFLFITRTTGATMQGMQEFWEFAFPPSGAWQFLKWFVAIHCGELFAYPVGSGNFGSVLTALLFVIGLCHFARAKRYFLTYIIAAPFVLGLVAAALHRYPYGGAYRIYQHVVPLIMLCVGAALATILKWRLPDAGRRRRWAMGIFAGLAVIGVIGLVRDCVRSGGRDIEWARAVGHCISRSVQPDDIVVFGLASHGNAVLDWYLLPVRDRMQSLEKITDADLARAKGDVWLLYCSNHENARGQRVPTRGLPAIQAFQRRMADSWILTDAVPYLHVGKGRDAGLRYCLTYRWCKSESTPTANLPVWPRD